MRHTPRVLTGWVPASTAVERMGLTRRPMVASDLGHPVSQAYGVLWAELAGLLS